MVLINKILYKYRKVIETILLLGIAYYIGISTSTNPFRSTYLAIFICIAGVLVIANSKKLFLFIFAVNIIAGDLLYLSPTLYRLPFQQELSFAFTGVSLLVAVMMLLKNKTHLVLPKRIYDIFIIFLALFLISAVINFVNVSIAIWSFINVFKYLVFFLVLTTLDTTQIESKVTKFIIGIVIFEFIMGLYSFLFYGYGIEYITQSYLHNVRGEYGTFFGDRLFITTLGGHNILGLAFSLLIVYLYEQTKVYRIRSRYYKIAFIMTLLIVFVFVTGKIVKLVVLLAFAVVLGREFSKRDRMVLPFALILIAMLAGLYFYSTNLSLSAYSGLGVALNPISYVVLSLKEGTLRPATYYSAFLILWQNSKLFFGFGPGMSGAFIGKFKHGEETFEQLLRTIDYQYKSGLGSLLDSQYADLGLQIGLIPLFFFVFFLLSIGLYCKKKGNIFPLVYVVMFLVSGISHSCWGLRSYSMIFWIVLALSVNRTLKKEYVHA